MQTNNWSKAAEDLSTLTEGVLFKKGKSTNVGAILGKAEQGEKVGKDGRAQGPDSKEDHKEDHKEEDAEGFAAFVDSKLPSEDAETETLTDSFHRFAEKVSKLEQGHPVDVDELRLELNGLDEQLATLGGEPELPAADHDAPEGGIGSRSMDER